MRNTGSRLPDIFLSYSRDDQATARLFAEGFEREGFSVWWDATLNPGEAFDQVTEKALREAKAVVVLWSKKSVDSRWVRAEAMQANDNKTLVPVMIEPCKRPIMFELTHTADLSQWTGDRKVNAWQSFVAGVRLYVERGGPVPAALPAASASPIIRASQRGAGTGNRTTIAALVVMGLALLGMALLAVPAFHHLRETPPPEMRLDIVTPATDQPDSFALSPDGRQIVFVASGDGASRLWLRPLASTTAQPLAGTEGATRPFWSPDSRSIGFFTADALKRIDLGGGAPQTLASALSGVDGTWNAEGVILFAPNLGSGPLMRVSAAGGAAVAATTMTAKQVGHVAPFFLPDGHRFLFAALGTSDTQGIYLGDLTGGAPTLLTNAPSAARYLPSGWMLWARDGALLAQRLDVAKAALTGAPVTLATGVAAGMDITASVSATGLVAYRLAGLSHTHLTWFDHSGAAQGNIGQRDMWMPRVAPDGQRVVYVRGPESPYHIWLLDGSRTSPLTSGTTTNWSAMWSPDGTRIVFESNTSADQWNLYEKLVNGAVGDEQPLMALGQVKESDVPTSWSPDGRFLLYDSFGPGPGADLWVLPMTGPRKPFAFLQSSFSKSSGVFSPDGRWVAYESNESGRNEIYVRPFRPPGEKVSDAVSASVQWQVSTSGGVAATWRPDGREIFYIDPSGAMMAAPITVSRDTLAAGTPVKLFQTKIFGGGEQSLGRNYDVAPDGRFLIETLDTALNSAAAPITLIQNWNPDATKQ
jgi:eukaryotic-like serine/threonine-protein kinase